MSHKESKYYYPNRFIKSRPFLNRFIADISSREDITLYFELLADEMVKQSRLDPTRHFDQTRLNERMYSEIENIYSYAKFRKDGSNIFSFSKELLTMLDKTDVDDIQFQNIKYPFRDYYISFRELERDAHGEHMEYPHKLDGAYISHEIDNALIIHLTGYNDNKESKNWIYHPDFSNINSLNFKTPEGTVKDGLSYLYNELKKITESKPKDLGANLERTFVEYTDNIRIVINCILFITSQANESKREYPSDTPGYLTSKLSKVNSKSQRQAIENEILGQGFTKINFIGNKFRGTLNEHRQGELSTHWRRGHWRNQPWGHELKERKMIWIQPTIVRADKGEPQKGHIYKVQD